MHGGVLFNHTLIIQVCFFTQNNICQVYYGLCDVINTDSDSQLSSATQPHFGVKQDGVLFPLSLIEGWHSQSLPGTNLVLFWPVNHPIQTC